MANYTKFNNVIVTNGIAVKERAKLSFIKESGGGGSGADREGPLTLYVDNLVTKNSSALKGEEEILTVAQVAKKRVCGGRVVPREPT